MSSWTVPVISIRFKKKFEFSSDFFFEKYSYIQSHKNPLMKGEFFHAHRHDEAKSRFCANLRTPSKRIILIKFSSDHRSEATFDGLTDDTFAARMYI